MVWKHGDNLALGFTCNYCQKKKKGGGATRLKEHLTECRSNVISCDRVSPDMSDYFKRELDRTREKRKEKSEERLWRQEAAAHVDLTSNNDETGEE